MLARQLPHIGIPVGSASRNTLVCGDPGRAARIAGLLDDASLLGEKREYRSYQGLFNGQPVTICSHGIGAPGAAIAFEELIAAGARRIIRVGTCGGMQPESQPGELVIATAAVDNTGYGRAVVPEGYPAVAGLDLTLALRTAAVENGRSYHTGIVLTSDNFYPGVPGPFMPDYKTVATAHVLAVEMECAALFIVGSLRDVQTAAILVVDGNVLQSGEDMETFNPDTSSVQTAVVDAARIALNAFRHMTKNDG